MQLIADVALALQSSRKMFFPTITTCFTPNRFALTAATNLGPFRRSASDFFDSLFDFGVFTLCSLSMSPQPHSRPHELGIRPQCRYRCQTPPRLSLHGLQLQAWPLQRPRNAPSIFCSAAAYCRAAENGGGPTNDELTIDGASWTDAINPCLATALPKPCDAIVSSAELQCVVIRWLH